MSIALIVFCVVYLGMMLGNLPGLKMDRASIALGGAIALMATEEMNQSGALASIDFSTIGMLFGLMLVSVQFEMSGLYGWLSAQVAKLQVGPVALLGLLTALVGGMSAFLTNDVVAVAMTPIILSISLKRGMNPIPFLLAIALAANAGSVATIIGSPQNMLIAEKLDLSFSSYVAFAAVPALVSLAVVWVCLALLYRDRWQLDKAVAGADTAPEEPPVDRWETLKGLAILGLVLYAFVFTHWNRGLVAATAGAFMLFNARFMSRTMLHRVDWDLLILFIGLFIVNGAIQATGLPQHLVADLQHAGFNLHDGSVLFIVTALLSDIASNVPTVMLLLPWATDPHSGPLMALASGLSSNLIVIGSLANIIVVDAANQKGLNISFGEFARVGVPVALASLALAFAWVKLIL